MTTAHIVALLREKDHYLRRGLPDRAAQVDAALELAGYEVLDEVLFQDLKDDFTKKVAERLETTALEAPSETTIPPRPRPRRSNPDG